MSQRKSPPKSTHQPPGGISAITVCGYKSLSREQRFEIRPLTILAGANSTGKSSALQPLLLLKQTLEASYDPGALLLNGPNVRFTSADQLLSRTAPNQCSDRFHIGIEGTDGWEIELSFKRRLKKGLDIDEMKYRKGDEITTFRVGMTHEQIVKVVPEAVKNLIQEYPGEKPELAILRERCFLSLAMTIRPAPKPIILMAGSPLGMTVGQNIERGIRMLIHLPGLRGNPERTYPTTAVGPTFPGLFHDYVASIISHWKLTKDERLQKLSKALETLGLTWKIDAAQVDGTQVEIQAARLPRRAKGGSSDLVSIADVGFGVSRTLPVAVALLVAEPGQIVYLEQPEIHLHPRAQFAMADILKDAALSGVRVVVETHSSLLLLGIQALVAEKKFPPDLVKLHWFTLRKNGSTNVTSADLDEAGAFGDWPEDFGEVALKAESRYLDAASR